MKTKFKDNEIGRIPEEWDVEVFSNVIAINPKRDIKKGTTARKISMQNLTEFKRKIDGFELSEFKGGSKFQNGDTIMARITPCLENGKTAYVDILEDNEIAFGSTEFIVLSGKDNLTRNDFVYYLAISPKIRRIAIQSMTGTSGRQRIQADLLGDVEIGIPSLEEQKAIAKILSDLDSKIELLQKQNKTLEAIGQAIFKHWFVDFEFPNEEGKPYKSSGGEMVDSELGEIPRGWGVGTLGDICEITMGQSPPGKTYNEIGKGTPFYQGNRDFGFRFPTRRVYCTAPTRFAEEGNVLLSVRAPVGNLNVAEERCAIGRGVVALRLNGKQHGYLYYLLRATQSGWNEFEAEGTVFGSANKSDVHGFKVVIPPNKSKEQFASLIKSLDDQIINNEKQSRALTSIRDTLLPKLMSGELRVSATGKLPEVIE